MRISTTMDKFRFLVVRNKQATRKIIVEKGMRRNQVIVLPYDFLGECQ